MNQSSLKQQNRGLILKLIATGECTSRISLSKRTGLSKMTTTNIIADFIADGVIEEREQIQVWGKGRNPIELVISPRAPKMVGLHVFRDQCSAILCDLQLNILKKSSFLLNEKSGHQFFPRLYRILDTVLKEADNDRIYGIGIGSSGPVDIQKGTILYPPNFHGIGNVEIISTLQDRYHLPIFFDSQYDCAALAERYYGNGRDADDFVFAGIANGVGSGIISGGKVLYSQSGLSSELGHMSVDVHGNHCSCGNRGCLETYISIPIIEHKMRMASRTDLSFQDFCRIQNDSIERTVKPIFHEMMDYLGCSLVSVVNMLNPQKIIIGHDGYWIPDQYLQQMETSLNQKKLSSGYKHVAVQKAFFQDESQFRGCVCSLLTKVFDGILF